MKYGVECSFGLSCCKSRFLLAALLFLGQATATYAATSTGSPAVPPSGLSNALSLGFHVDSEAVSNVLGGLRTGTRLDTLAKLGVTLDTAPMGWWSGGRLYISAMGIDSGQPSRNDIGDAQSVSNIEAPNAGRLYTFWYRQRFAATDVRFGLIDMNTLFDVTDAASDLLNASFGLDPTLSANLPVSTFPKPGYGVVVTHTRHPLGWKVGVFQGNPNERESVLNGGAMMIGEVDYGQQASDPTRVSFGLWRYRRSEAAVAPSQLWGGYLNVTQLVYKGAATESRVFVQLGACPSPGSTAPRHIGLGLDVSAPFPGRPNDRFLLALTQESLRGLKAETAYEVAYVWTLGPHYFLEPDMQYVQHPGGYLPNATVLMLRAHVEF